MVSVPDRGEVDAFAATLYPTEPGPFPGVPDVMLTKPELLDAIQPHPACVVTVTEPVPRRC